MRDGDTPQPARPPWSSVVPRRTCAFSWWAVRRCRAKADCSGTTPSEYPADTPCARIMLCPHGAAQGSTRDHRTATHHLPGCGARVKPSSATPSIASCCSPACAWRRARENESDPPARRDPRRRCRGVFAADGGGRGGHARTPQGAAPRAPRSENRRAPRPHRRSPSEAAEGFHHITVAQANSREAGRRSGRTPLRCR